MTFASVRAGIEHWAFRRTAPHPQALLRAGLGAFLLFYWGLKVGQVPALFSSEALWLPWPDATWHPLFQWLTQAPSPALAYGIYAAFMLCLLCFAVGLRMRETALLAAVFYVYYWLISLHLFPTSYDRLFPFLLVVMAFSAGDRALSVRMWWKYGSLWAWDEASVLGQRIVALQVAFTYLGVGWQKMVLPAWQSGDVLAQSVMGIWGTPLAFWLTRWNVPAWVYDKLTFIVMALEFCLPIGLWVPRWQWLFFAMGAVFHILIAVLMGIWWFLVLIPAYVAFIEPETLLAMLRRVLPGIPESPGAPPSFSPRHFGLGRRRTMAAAE
ncbi:MAG: hypothetical protein KBC95_04945 [Candidatus Peribacteraceae bacterium]|nr:hypothetical protein [Candidatus Peribacteraceae bacterium]